MKVLQINKYHYRRAGAEAVFFNTMGLLQEHGHTVIPFTTKHPQNLPSQYEQFFVDTPELRDLSTLKKILATPRFFWNSKAAQKLEELVALHRPDVAHIHNMFNGLSLSILPVLQRHGIPVVLTLHDSRLICPTPEFNTKGTLCDDCTKTYGINCALHRCYRNNWMHSIMCALEMVQHEAFFDYNQYINQYIFVSHRYQQHYSKRHEYFATKGSVLYNFFLRLNEIQPTPQHGTYFLFYGRLTEEKGIFTLLQAIKRLPNVQLHVAGTGPLYDQLVADAPANVTYLGYLTGRELDKEIANASFIIVPSEVEENNPMTIVEAFSHGKPVIGAQIGGIPELIEPGVTGYQFRSGNAEELYQCIRQATEVSSEQYQQMTANARAFAEQHFDPEVHYQKLMALYNSIIKAI